MDQKAKNRVMVPDRISELPDSVLCHILSFLPTLFSVRTTVLSTRWNNLWTSVPNLVFYQQDFYGYPRAYEVLMTFVDRVLSLRDSSDIRKFLVHCSPESPYLVKEEDFSRIDHWICTAIRHNAVELDICFYARDLEARYPFHTDADSEVDEDLDSEDDEDFEIKDKLSFRMPETVFTSKNLTVLKVESDCITYAATTPDCFPRLKIMHVVSYNYDSTSLEKLFCHCPVLEHLSLGGNPGRDVLNFNIYSPELKKFGTEWDILGINDHNCSFFINAPKLEKLIVKGDGLSKLILENSESLIQAEMSISVQEDYDWETYEDRVATFLAGISSVHYLSLSAPHFAYFRLPSVFQNLKKLDLSLYDCPYWYLLFEFLRRSPNLESLCFGYESTLENFRHYGNRCPKLESVPCLSSSLKTILMRKYLANKNEKKVVKYLLKYCEVLEKMTISTSLLVAMFVQDDEVYEEIMSFPRVSENCIIELN